MDERRAETRRKRRPQQHYRRLTCLTVLALLLAGGGVWFAARADWGPAAPPDGGAGTSQGEDGSQSAPGSGSQGDVSPEEPPDSSQDPPPEEKTGQPAWFVPESQAVDASWYDDAVFLGDSRLDGFRLYAGPSGATYFTEAGAKALSIQEKNTERLPDGSKVPMLKALEGKTFSKVYLNLGMNNLGDYDLQKEFVDAYADDIDRIRAIQPDCDIYLMTLFPVTAEQEAKGSYVNNRAIDDLNSCIRYLAAQKGTYLLEVDGLLRDADGNLPSEDSFDGIHLTPDACKLWRSYLDTHTIQKSATESERSP